MESYKTLRAETIAEFTEKKSRFIAFAAPVENEAEAASVLGFVRKSHTDASHNCFAYRTLDTENNFATTQKYSDDGEPGGTAGQPIFGVIQANELHNCIIVVTRYYGGIQLGAGGLVRAYSGAASLAVKQAEIATVQKLLTLNVTAGYGMADKLLRRLESGGFAVRNVFHTEHVTLDVLTLGERADALRGLISEATNGAALVRECGYGYEVYNRLGC